MSVQNQVPGAGELDHSAPVGEGEALGVELAERTLDMHLLGTGGCPRLELDGRRVGQQRGAVVPVELDVAGEIELSSMLVVDPLVGLDHQPAGGRAAEVGLHVRQIDPIGIDLPRDGRRQRIRPVARVDAVNYSPRLYEVAMQAALATGDPASLCSIATPAASVSDEPSWPLAQAMCAALSGESGTASALVDRVRDDRAASGIDVLLAEKVVGAATNSRRAVTIQWDGVERLDAWRYGLAVATGVAIPTRLFSTVGPQVQAWHARAPLIAPAARAGSVELATAMGVFSSAALVDFYGDLWTATDPAERSGSVGELLRTAYSGEDDGAKLAAMKSLWNVDGPAMVYARQVMTARAAAMLPVASTNDSDAIIASMLSVGLDIQAVRWSSQVPVGSIGWAQLAVASPRAIAGVDASAVRSVPGGENDRRNKFLLAGLAGLGRLPVESVRKLAESYAVPLGHVTSWTRAIDHAAALGQSGTVIVLAAAGLQTREWRYVPPEHLFHIVAALRRVGFEPEARMIAAEALART